MDLAVPLSTLSSTWALELTLGGILVTLALSLVSVLVHVLTPNAAIAAAVFGILIVLLGGAPYLAMLILFVVGGSLATRYGWEEKAERKLAEGRKGERGVANVVSHILVPLGLVVLLPLTDLGSLQGFVPFVYVSALACGTADTMASEFGVLSGKAVNILGGGSVAAGTNGGISLAGELFAVVGSLLTVAAGAGIFFLFGGLAVLLPSVLLWFTGGTALGFVGCQVDSLLGATLENGGYLGKGSVNFLAMLITALLAASLYWA